MDSLDVVRRVCLLQQVYQGYPLVLLNCARVTAKLSLFGCFRATLGANRLHMKCMVDVVVGEADLCRRVMDGGGNDNCTDNRSGSVFGTDPGADREYEYGSGSGFGAVSMSGASVSVEAWPRKETPCPRPGSSTTPTAASGGLCRVPVADEAE
ncbi:hypothetical protein B484DRAFT_412144 [Ochromonadaceae sp. CCMP2298]|nr:hypothetical protein B484DRAFT_412144 [Ochromonadaceae sp. CCMP2298]